MKTIIVEIRDDSTYESILYQKLDGEFLNVLLELVKQLTKLSIK